MQVIMSRCLRVLAAFGVSAVTAVAVSMADPPQDALRVNDAECEEYGNCNGAVPLECMDMVNYVCVWCESSAILKECMGAATTPPGPPTTVDCLEWTVQGACGYKFEAACYFDGEVHVCHTTGSVIGDCHRTLCQDIP